MKQYYQPHLVVYANSLIKDPLELLKTSNEFSQFKLNNQNTINYNQNDLDLSIDKVRKLINESYLLNNQKTVKFLLVFYLDQASIPAQNALLKLTEEPPYNLKIIYFIKDENKVIDTIKSRCLLTKTKTNSSDLTFIENNLPNLNKKFLSKGIITFDLDDYLMIEEFLKKSKKTLPDLTDQKKILIILEDIIRQLHSNLKNNNFNGEDYQILKKFNQSYNLISKNLNAKLVLFKLFFCLENKIPLLFDPKM